MMDGGGDDNGIEVVVGPMTTAVGPTTVNAKTPMAMMKAT
jgi:hypothetical protein